MTFRDGPIDSRSRIIAATIAVAGILTILGAYYFQYVLGLPPCPLCLEQRYAYYVSIPVLFVALVLVAAGRPVPAAVLFAAVATAFLANAALAGYHAGAEWKLWAGPDTCAAPAGSLSTSAGSLLEDLRTVRVVRCDEPAVLVLGLSLAAWNVIASLVIAAGAFRAAAETWQSRSLA